MQRIAKAFEVELEKRLDSVKEKLKPPMMRFMEKLKTPSGVDRRLAGDTIREVEDSSRIVQAVKERANIMDQLSRSELVGFLLTIFHLRDSFLEEEIQAGVDVMQVQFTKIVHFLNFLSRSWQSRSSSSSVVRPSPGWRCPSGRPSC